PTRPCGCGSCRLLLLDRRSGSREPTISMRRVECLTPLRGSVPGTLLRSGVHPCPLAAVGVSSRANSRWPPGASAGSGARVPRTRRKGSSSAPAGGPEGGVGAAEVGGDAGGAEPGGDGAAAAGEEGAGEQVEQARGGAAVEGGGEGGERGGQEGGQLREWH